MCKQAQIYIKSAQITFLNYFLENKVLKKSFLIKLTEGGCDGGRGGGGLGRIYIGATDCKNLENLETSLLSPGLRYKFCLQIKKRWLSL